MVKTTKTGNKKEKEWIIGILSLFNKEAERFAKRLAKLVPKNHWIRSELFTRAFGPFNAWIEDKSDGLPPVMGALLEKMSDFGESFATALLGDDDQKPADAVSGEEWVEKLTKDAEKRLREAPDPEAELKKIKREFELMTELLQFFKEKRAVPEEPAPHEEIDLITEINSAARSARPHIQGLTAWIRNR